MEKVIFLVIGLCVGFVSTSVYFEYKVDKTGVLQLDAKIYSCQEYKGEFSK